MTITDIPHAADNPRNSEGSFIGLQDDRILFAYTRYSGSSGGGDHDSADIVGRYSSDGGHSWSEPHLILPNEGSQNIMSVSLLRLHDGRMALFYLCKNGLNDCRPWLRLSIDEGCSWSERIGILDHLGYFVLNNDRVVQLSSGRIILPLAHHYNIYPAGTASQLTMEKRAHFIVAISDDHGASWRRGPESWLLPSGRHYLQEPGIIELADGRLWCYMRSNSGKQWQSFSVDQGESWSVPAVSPFLSPSSPLSAKRLPGGNALIAIWNDTAKACELWGAHKKVPIIDGVARDTSWGRTPLVYAISDDEGATWSPSRLIESEPDHGYCYTAIHFTDDAMLLGYCCGGGTTSHVLQDLRIRRIPLNTLH